MITLEKMEAYMKFEELLQMSNSAREEIEQFLSMGIDPNFKNSEGKTPLITAAETGDTAIVELILEKGIDPNIQDKFGKTALIRAAEKGHTKAVSALLQNEHTKPNITDKFGKTALMYTTDNGYTDTTEILLKHGADPNIKAELSPGLKLVWEGRIQLKPNAEEGQ